MFREIVFPFDPNLRERFITKDSSLIKEWTARYPFLFDCHDITTAQDQAPREKGGFHFYEWLAAILIYEGTGFLSLVEGYQGKKHKCKQEVMARLLPERVRSLVLRGDGHSKTQGPDLLVYAKDYSSYFFCEVKGPGDRLRPAPLAFFEAIARESARPVMVARFVPITSWLSSGSHAT